MHIAPPHDTVDDHADVIQERDGHVLDNAAARNLERAAPHHERCSAHLAPTSTGTPARSAAFHASAIPSASAFPRSPGRNIVATSRSPAKTRETDVIGS